jgi:hypothetical protein
MLSIGKLAKGQEGYYLDAVARGVEDYHLEGEAPGCWLGAGTALLGLAGEVDSDSLATVLAGRDPTTDTRLRSSKGGHGPGSTVRLLASEVVPQIIKAPRTVSAWRRAWPAGSGQSSVSAPERHLLAS